MGEFTQNLLKLTEFPFSYSLIGLLALIFGHGTILEELSFAKIGPLLILIGFVATTLSICDPVGAIQRQIIKGRELDLSKLKNINDIIWADVFGSSLAYHFPLPYFFAILDSPEAIKKRYTAINWDPIKKKIQEEKGMYRQVFNRTVITDALDKISRDDLIAIPHLLEGLKQQTVKTKWITGEIDRITALIYFIIIISLFIAATQLYPTFLQNFAQFFVNIELAKLAILIFSISALIAICIMFILRILGLLGKAATVFKYLTALGVIKTAKENFRETLQEIERYLNNNDWTLAEYWVERIQDDYTELFLKKILGETKELEK
jgi:hypothetical protein